MKHPNLMLVVVLFSTSAHAGTGKTVTFEYQDGMKVRLTERPSQAKPTRRAPAISPGSTYKERLRISSPKKAQLSNVDRGSFAVSYAGDWKERGQGRAYTNATSGLEKAIMSCLYNYVYNHPDLGSSKLRPGQSMTDHAQAERMVYLNVKRFLFIPKQSLLKSDVGYNRSAGEERGEIYISAVPSNIDAKSPCKSPVVTEAKKLLLELSKARAPESAADARVATAATRGQPEQAVVIDGRLANPVGVASAELARREAEEQAPFIQQADAELAEQRESRRRKQAEIAENYPGIDRAKLSQIKSWSQDQQGQWKHKRGERAPLIAAASGVAALGAERLLIGTTYPPSKQELEKFRAATRAYYDELSTLSQKIVDYANGEDSHGLYLRGALGRLADLEKEYVKTHRSK